MNFQNNGLYLFPDGKMYVAAKPGRHSSMWAFYTLELWFMSPDLQATWVRFHTERWMKNVRRTIRNKVGVKLFYFTDDNVLFTGTVLAKKIKGKRLPKPDRDWFWKQLDFREREKYR